MKVMIYKHKSGWWGIFRENSTEPMKLFDTELECYKYAMANEYYIV